MAGHQRQREWQDEAEADDSDDEEDEDEGDHEQGEPEGPGAPGYEVEDRVAEEGRAPAPAKREIDPQQQLLQIYSELREKSA